MSYQLIVDSIRDSANAVNASGTFIHGRRSDGSIEYDGTMPQIHLYPFITQPNDINSSLVTANIVMGFWSQDSPSTSNEEREAIIAAMDVLSKEFLTELDTLEFTITAVRKEPQYRTLSGVLSGYALTFTFQVWESSC